MKKALGLILTAIASSSAMAAPFTLEQFETNFYYLGQAEEAAEAKLWKAALTVCGSNQPGSSHLPMRVSKIKFEKPSSFMVTATGEFVCRDADGREL